MYVKKINKIMRYITRKLKLFIFLYGNDLNGYKLLSVRYVMNGDQFYIGIFFDKKILRKKTNSYNINDFNSRLVKKDFRKILKQILKDGIEQDKQFKKIQKQVDDELNNW